jgi:transglutaminase-like putative cysteine protease
MLIRAGYEIEFDLPSATTLTAMLNVVPGRRNALRRPDLVRVYANGVKTERLEYFSDHFGNCVLRIAAPAGSLRLYNDFVIEDAGLPQLPPVDQPQRPIATLPPSCLEFLLPSRYCEVDKLGQIAWQLFGHLPQGWPRVKGVMDWVHQNVKFGYEFARNTRTAAETYEERHGVCRDFNHLAVTFCRALNIPARYATGYLGDFGVPYNPAPMDFSACFEVFLGDRWHLLDARHNQARIGWILMARGRDAADCAITTSFGTANLTKFQVWTEEFKPEGIPLLEADHGDFWASPVETQAWRELRQA